MTDKELLEYAIKELSRICMGAVSYNYAGDDDYYVLSYDVGCLLRVLKGWDEPRTEES